MTRAARRHPVDPHTPGRKVAGYGAALAILSRLKPGETWVYRRDRERRCAGAFAAAYDAYVQGTVTLTQRREDGVLQWVATRRGLAA
jgi:hypothetical protein